MNESTFIKQNKNKWEEFERLIKNGAATNADKLAEIYIKITDDLSFSRTHFMDSQLTLYLNNLASDLHLSIFKNKKEDSFRIINFWKHELPQVMSESLKYVLISFTIFIVSGIIGALSAAHDDTFVAGRECTQIDNTANNYIDALVDVKGITGGATVPAVGDKIQLFVWGSDVSLATTPIMCGRPSRPWRTWSRRSPRR